MILYVEWFQVRNRLGSVATQRRVKYCKNILHQDDGMCRSTLEEDQTKLRFQTPSKTVHV